VDAGGAAHFLQCVSRNCPRRPGGSAGIYANPDSALDTRRVKKATEDPYIIRTYGEFAIELQGADAAARETARQLQQDWEKGDALTPQDRGELMVKVSGVKALSTKVALDITSRIFEVIGSRGTHPKYGFDRFWRNVRTHSLHDPVAYKIADVGNHALNGSYPVPGFTS